MRQDLIPAVTLPKSSVRRKPDQQQRQSLPSFNVVEQNRRKGQGMVVPVTNGRLLYPPSSNQTSGFHGRMAVVAPWKVFKAAQRGGRKKPRQSQLAIACSVLLIVLAYLSLRAGTRVAPLLLSPCASKERTGCSIDAGIGLDAVAYICAGTGCDAELLCASVAALRGPAGWAGPVHVFTDGQPSNLFHCMRPLALVEHRIQTPQVDMEFKNLKRKLLQHLPALYSRVLYIDGDNIPVGCMRSFMQAVLASHPSSSVGIGMFPDNTCASCNQLNGGFMYMERRSDVQQCLDAWTSISSSKNMSKYVKDQDALDVLLRQHKASSPCAGVITKLYWAHIAYIDSALWPGRVRALTTRPYFLHFTKGVRASKHWRRIMKSIHKALEPYMQTAHANAQHALSTC